MNLKKAEFQASSEESRKAIHFAPQRSQELFSDISGTEGANGAEHKWVDECLSKNHTLKIPFTTGQLIAHYSLIIAEDWKCTYWKEGNRRKGRRGRAEGRKAGRKGRREGWKKRGKRKEGRRK